MFGRVLVALVVALLTFNTLLADDPKLPEGKAYDKLVVDALRDVHNTGADLYNLSRDFAGAYRLYQGALVTVRPLLAHQPNAQKLIETGLMAAEKDPDIAMKAFRLHETIESVRGFLKTGAMPSPKAEETKKPAVQKPMESTDSKKTEEKKPIIPAETKKTEEKKPAMTYEVAPQPREKK